MAVCRETIGLMSYDRTPSYISMTPQAKEAVTKSEVKEEAVAVTSSHTTCPVFFEEFVHDVTEDEAEYLQTDLSYILQKIIPNQAKLPPEGGYIYPGRAHFGAVAQWPDVEFYLPGGDKTRLLGEDAHLKATILGSSQVFLVGEGKLGAGVTGYVYFMDLDRMRARSRKCKIVVMNE